MAVCSSGYALWYTPDSGGAFLGALLLRYAPVLIIQSVKPVSSNCKGWKSENPAKSLSRMTVRSTVPMPDFFFSSRLRRSTGLLKKLSDFFTDNRDQEKITHSLGALLKQRIFGICQGYEDLNDHERLREDPLLQYIGGRDNKTLVAGKSTLNRLEFSLYQINL